MHPNPAFRQTDTDRSFAFARHRGFGVLCVNGPDRPLLAHIPFMLSDDGSTVDLHLVRSNPIARLDMPLAATLAVSGPDGYVSPDWYGVPDQVPTWNYVAVHLIGTLTSLPQDAMRDLLDRELALFEAALPKPEWTADKMTPDVLDRMMRQIVPFRMTVASVDSTWKLGQNKPDAVRHAAADHVAHGHGHELAALADLMRSPPATKS